jgi:hypothetical protein
LKQLLEANGVAVPADGNPVEEQPPIRLGAGVRTLLTSTPAGPTVPAETPGASSTLSVENTVTSSTSAPASSGRSTFTGRLIIPLLAGDALLCLLAWLLGVQAAESGSTGSLALCVLAVATGAWLSCEAVRLHLHGRKHH